MRIAAISLVKNEADIIECFVRHTLAFVDSLYVIDDRSTDTTPHILRMLRDEFPRLHIVNDQWNAGFSQAQRTTQLMHDALADNDWDIVTALDADEFIAAGSRDDFEEDLSRIPEGMAGSYYEICYVVSPQDDPSILDPRQRMRSTIDRNRLSGFKAIVPRFLRRHGVPHYTAGNHDVTVSGSAVANWPLPRVRLAHFPLRSAEHAAVKAMTHYVGWKSCQSFTPKVASHVMQSVEVLRNAPSLSLPNPVDLIARFMPETLIAERVDRPFVESRGTIKWPELARPLPYQQIIGLIDQLITRATIGDRLAYAGDAASTDADRLEALVKERATLEQELKALRGSRSRLAAAYVQALNDKMIRDSREWRLRLQAYLSRWRAASG